MATTFVEEVTFQATNCPACGATFCVNNWFLEKRKEDGQAFYCPSGHSISFAEPELVKLRKQLAAEQARHDQTKAKAQTLERSRAAIQGQVTKLKKRAAGGTCPCCNRYFAALHRHMQSKHPEFPVEEIETAEQPDQLIGS